MPRTGNPRFKAKVGKYIFSDLDSRINMTTLKPPGAVVWERPGLVHTKHHNRLYAPYRAFRHKPAFFRHPGVPYVNSARRGSE